MNQVGIHGRAGRTFCEQLVVPARLQRNVCAVHLHVFAKRKHFCICDGGTDQGVDAERKR
jgi:hypothetical protein